ncbi:trans-aconitate 2-methyltransferase [Methanobrevibacter sp.]|uniref:class I SAM-dependent methyltransferase n=1 Tax=Methanobrevibacter sp. TaxID=66852 RepID=UPI0025EBF9F6|nr:class I SAM-dependent methyltransferase [Methanobrevibacter sp.]MBQ2666074.1 class I SAM-dependent methyltransferase [Methanobrevibacter sp.]
MIRLSYDVKRYRRDILDLIKPDDTVIELGCHTGGTTRLLPQTCNVIALDNSPEAGDEMKKLPHVNFINADVRLHDVLTEVYSITQSCNLLIIDLGGGYHPDTVFKVFYIWSSTFKPEHTVIRNRGLLEFFNSAKGSGEDYISDKGYLESYYDSGIPPQIKEFDLWTSALKK